MAGGEGKLEKNLLANVEDYYMRVNTSDARIILLIYTVPLQILRIENENRPTVYVCT